MKMDEVLAAVPLLQNGSLKTQNLLSSCACIKTFRRGEHLFLDREEVYSIYFMVEGVASFYKLGSQDEKRVIFLLQKGEILNEEILDGRPASVNCDFLVDSKVLCFDKMKFLHICQQDFQFTTTIMDAMALKIRRLYHQIKNTVNSMRGDKKLAAKLWKLAKDYGVSTEDGIEIGFPLSITFLAELVGSKRETVSRQIRLLTDANLVKIDRKRITVLDSKKLLEYVAKM